SVAGSSQAGQSDRDSTSGIRGCTSPSAPTAAVVTMAQLTSRSAPPPQNSYRPASARTDPSRGVTEYGCRPDHSYQPSAGTRQRRAASASRNDGFSAAVSARALIRRAPGSGASAQDGTSPQRSRRSSRRRGPPGATGGRDTTAATCLPGATL